MASAIPPVLTIAASLHLIAFALICVVVPKIHLLSFQEHAPVLRA